MIEAEEHRDSDTMVPIAAAFLIFMLVMTVAPAGLNNVLEEKMQKISEVLIAAVSPFQLILGKLLGTVMVAGVLSVLYVGLILGVLEYHGLSELVSAQIILWFAFFQLMALLIFGAMFLRDRRGLLGDARCADVHASGDDAGHDPDVLHRDDDQRPERNGGDSSFAVPGGDAGPDADSDRSVPRSSRLAGLRWRSS